MSKLVSILTALSLAFSGAGGLSSGFAGLSSLPQNKVPKVQAAPVASNAIVKDMNANAARPVVQQSEYDQQVLAEINKARAENGLKPVVADEWLIQDSEEWSQNLVDNDAFEHNPDRLGAKEIIAKAPTPERTVNAWLNSTAGHREMVLDPDIDRIGLGTAKFDDSEVRITTGQPSVDPMKKPFGFERNDAMEYQIAVMGQNLNHKYNWGLDNMYSGGTATKQANAIAANNGEYVPPENTPKQEQVWSTTNPDPRGYYHDNLVNYMESGQADGAQWAEVGTAQSENGEWIMVTHWN